MLSKDQARSAAQAVMDPAHRRAAAKAGRLRRFFAFAPSTLLDAVPAHLLGEAVASSTHRALRHPVHLLAVALWIGGAGALIYFGVSWAYLPAILGAVATIRVRQYLADRYIERHYLSSPNPSLERP
jgi:hypothetical protein